MIGRRTPRALAAVFTILLIAGAAGCRKEPPKRYPLQGQILAIDTAKAELTIKHGDIPNLMPAMTMSYPVSSPKLLDGRTPGELISAVLEVDNSVGRIVEVIHTGNAPVPNPNQAGMASGVLDIGDEVPDTAFIDQNDKRRTISEWKGTTTVVTFIYTRCPLPNFCPLMDQNFATLQRRLADDTILRGRIKLITITFDPEHDTPEVLADHAKKLKADPAIWTFLTGDTATVERFAGKFGISVMREAQTPAEIVHNLRTFVLGPDGRVARIYTGNDWTPGTVLSDLRGVVGGSK